MKLYLVGFHTRFPWAPLIMASGSGAMKPLWASSKDVLSENGRAFTNAALASLVEASAGLGSSADHAGFDPASVRMDTANGAIRARTGVAVRFWPTCWEVCTLRPSFMMDSPQEVK